MQVFYGLSRVLAAVRDDAEAVGKAEFLRQFGDDREDMADQRGVVLSDLVRCGDVLLLHEEKMLRRQGLNVIERIAEVVLIDLLRGDLPGNNLAENAVFHDFSPYFAFAMT